ncbi:MAG: hypothetical protein GC155_17980 [Alphaproteobacteria bacterium]|nr:hypothetical protein [Alphaproteobacteria bacterium]
MRRVAAGAACLAVLAFGPPTVSAALAQASAYVPPRTADGRPALGGDWTHDGDPPIERPDDVAPAPDGPKPYLVADPPDGKLPLRDRAAAMAWRDKYAVYMSGAPEPDFTLGVDTLPNRDRCLMAANAAAPPMTSQGYNDEYQIVETAGFIAISVEMMHETRIIPVFRNRGEAVKAHGPQVLQRWTGDSVGWWEGDTFVVETVNINVRQGAQSAMPMSKDVTIVERFTRTSEKELLYRAEVTDPAIYTRPWTLEARFKPGRRSFEYACHEGNYGLVGILEGVRKTERDAAAKRGRKP